MARTRPTPMPCKGTAVVTGAGKRLGAAIAIALAKDGWDIAVHYSTSRDGADETVAAIAAIGRRAEAFGADLSDESATQALMGHVTTALSKPTCLVNSASLFKPDDATDFGYDALTLHMRINAAAPILLARTMHARLGERQRGVIVNLLDQKLFNLNPDFLSYTLSKAALHTATDLLARALAPKLRVVGIAPGITLPSGDQTKAEFAKAHARTPLGASSVPDDITQAICFVVNAPAITGTTLIVDGGQHLVPSERDVMFVTGPR